MELQRMNRQHALETIANIIENNPFGFQQILDAAHLSVINKRKILERQKQQQQQQQQQRLHDLDMIKIGFRLPPPPDQFIEPIHVRAQEARKWGKRIKLRKETTLAMKELQLPLAAIINIVDFI